MEGPRGRRGRPSLHDTRLLRAAIAAGSGRAPGAAVRGAISGNTALSAQDMSPGCAAAPGCSVAR
eukprot:scaffold3456_cov340-Prasinococcus_capsulatus_cf.AAC.4